MPPQARRLILTLNQVRALNAISRAKNVQPRFQAVGTSNFVVSNSGIRFELSNTNVVDRHYRRLMRELEEHGYFTESNVPTSVFREPDTTQPDDDSSSSSSSESDQQPDDGTPVHGNDEAEGHSSSNESGDDTAGSTTSSSSTSSDDEDNDVRTRYYIYTYTFYTKFII